METSFWKLGNKHNSCEWIDRMKWTQTWTSITLSYNVYQWYDDVPCVSSFCLYFSWLNFILHLLWLCFALALTVRSFNTAKRTFHIAVQWLFSWLWLCSTVDQLISDHISIQRSTELKWHKTTGKILKFLKAKIDKNKISIIKP